jgi:hypothetical protein
MLKVINEKLYKSGEREDIAFIKGLRALEKGGIGVKVASLQDTHLFGMSGSVASGGPLGATGVLAGLNDSSRQKYLDYCPELKMLFPSLHSPHCFGAEPDPLECLKFLCGGGGLKCRELVLRSKGKGNM